MPRFTRNRKVAVTVLALFAVAGLAYAYWTTTGSGSGSASTGTNAAITVTQTSTISGLYPGGPAQTLSGKFNNPNPGGAQVHQVDATISSVTGPNIDGTHPCTASDYTLGSFPVTVDAEIPPGAGVGAWTGGTILLKDTATNQDGCKNATVNLAYTSN